jgi:hypothetical protein
MDRRSLGRLLPALAALAWLAAPGAARADDPPFAGSWKVTFFDGDKAVTIAIVKVAGTDEKPRVRLVDSWSKFGKATLENGSVDAKAVRFTLKRDDDSFVAAFHPPKDDKAPKKLLGTLRVDTDVMPAQLESTTDKEVDGRTAVVQAEGFDELVKVETTRSDEDRLKIIKDVLAKHAGRAVAFTAASLQLRLKARDADSSEADLKAAAEQLLKAAAPFGPELALTADRLAAVYLLRSDRGAALAVEFARKAQGQLSKTDPAALRFDVVKTLVRALRKSGKADDAKPFLAELAALGEELDREFEKANIPFKPERFGGRKGKGQRVAVVELFTGAECPPCVAADVAFDAAMKRYNYSEVVFLQYHLHIPRPDPLTNDEGDKRSDFYGVESTPTMLVNGKPTEPIGGGRDGAQEAYDELRKLLDAAVEEDAKATIKLNVQRKGDKLDIKADVSDLKRTGDKVRLRLVLIEGVAHHAGGNGQRLHRNVVRAFPGGLDGLPLKEATATQNVSFNLAELRKGLNEYLDDFEKKYRKRASDDGFQFEDRPMALKDLKLVALIQDDATKGILQAAQVRVPEE